MAGDTMRVAVSREGNRRKSKAKIGTKPKLDDELALEEP